MNGNPENDRPMAQALTPCGRTRREFLWEAARRLRRDGAGHAAGRRWLLAAIGAPLGRGCAGTRSSPLAPKKPHFPAKAKACIVLFMYGGVSQVDTFDPKTELTAIPRQADSNPRERPAAQGAQTRASCWRSSRKFARHGQAGIAVSDLFPHLARCAGRRRVIRSMYTDSFAHGSGLLQMNTGFVRQGYPSMGSWVTYGLGTVNRTCRATSCLLDHRGGPISGPPNWGSGFMPATYQGTQFRTSGDPILNLRAAGRNLGRPAAQPARPAGQAEPSTQAGADNAELSARIASYELAFRMQAEAPEAVDLASESAETKRLYGLDDPRTERFGRRCLMAPRLVERGVRFVQVYSGGGHNDENWDAHGDVNKNHELHCGETDQPIAGAA